MRRDAWGSAVLCVLLTTPGALAEQAVPGAPAMAQAQSGLAQSGLAQISPAQSGPATARLGGVTTIMIPRTAPAGPSPGGFTLLNPEEVQTAARDAALRPPPCSGRSHAGREIGSLIGGLAGLAAAIALSDDDDGRDDQRAAQAAGAIIGGTAGYLAGAWYDGPDSCGTTRLPDRVPVIFLSDDQLDRLEHRRQTPGQATLPPREPGR
ncbi:hypothetical protein [Oleisolibacter albus]|uniref:hypothetical protein n=1 Tax=Oleisolibacter albus TaxID=2171757 RepID=UPI000DF1849F|nr:hypothetical protein [Oleisolibacter albus]